MFKHLKILWVEFSHAELKERSDTWNGTPRREADGQATESHTTDTLKISGYTLDKYISY